MLTLRLCSSRSHCISQILESVNHIHQHDIVHRDLKVSGCLLPWQPHTSTRTHTSARGHGNAARALGFPPAPPLRPSPVPPSSHLSASLAVCLRAPACADLVSHGHVEGLVSHPRQGETRTLNTLTHTHVRFVLIGTRTREATTNPRNYETTCVTSQRLHEQRGRGQEQPAVCSGSSGGGARSSPRCIRAPAGEGPGAV